ncbi:MULTISPECIES: acyl-CoA dehydrogenase family protein [Nocardia]|uniref:Acyl-CoA dehydrogenase family protein n=1 Tax=Nocardia implantans TaxID=3108168 RepID=A0ABU6AS74_9NOCA|nr:MULTISPECIES: acyl-CoA dehydrogenase family protein [unclassified Nocardia]MBF6191648.1 acyl-CoA dehydrogenase [Nocardia beijingensis]MEA3528045.1 acyl-CoA dehydrogenase family protein [Nocardia sp. CDC192]MEB3510203.1 acyl-CoA dehydrogenase family protein [Nocardia sp. CDC186]
MAETRPDQDELGLLTDTLRKTMSSATGRELDAALAGIGWPELLAELPEVAVPLVFRLLGETGAHAAVLDDVVRHRSGRPGPGPVPLPFAGAWVVWDRDGAPGATVDAELPLRTVATGVRLPEQACAAGRRALGWWLLGTGHAMLSLARRHALARTQFGRPLASFQAVRHRLAETLVALEGAEAALHNAEDDFGALLGKAAAGQAALTAARHCQQVLGGIGFTAEHDLHRHVRRTLVLDGLLGSSRELVREAGAHIRAAGSAPRLAQL